jgi:hypothetical protein
MNNQKGNVGALRLVDGPRPLVLKLKQIAHPLGHDLVLQPPSIFALVVLAVTGLRKNSLSVMSVLATTNETMPEIEDSPN